MEKESSYGHLIAHALLAGGAAYGLSKYIKDRKKEKDLKVKLQKVDSSMIRELGYVPESKSMHARFNTGKRYKFKDMSYSDYRKLKNAESIGSHFNKHVKDKYKFEKLSFMSAGTALIAGSALAGGVGGAVMKDGQGRKGGVGGFLSGAMLGAGFGLGAKSLGSKVIGKVKGKPPVANATPAANTTPAVNSGNTVQTTGTLQPPAEKLASYNGICLVDEELFEKSASVTALTHTAIGAGIGALTAGEGNRMQGALFGAAAGFGGSMLGKTMGRSSAVKGMTPAQQTKLTQQQAQLDATLKNTKGMSAKHDAIESFVKNPNNAEFAQAYRSSMQGAAGAAALGGLGAGLMTNKVAAYKAVERLHNVRRES